MRGRLPAKRNPILTVRHVFSSDLTGLVHVRLRYGPHPQVDAEAGRDHIRPPHFEDPVPWTRFVTSPSLRTLITVRPRSSINCCANPALFVPTKKSRSA